MLQVLLTTSEEKMLFCIGIYLDIVVDENLPEVEDLKDGLGRVVRDGVTLQHVLDSAHLPSQPTLGKSGVHAQGVGKVTWKQNIMKIVVCCCKLNKTRDCCSIV